MKLEMPPLRFSAEVKPESNVGKHRPTSNLKKIFNKYANPCNFVDFAATSASAS